MTAPGPGEDDLLDELGAAVRAAGTPTAAMSDAARVAFSWRTVDAELAALASDSLVDEPAGVRGSSAGPRDLVFEGRDSSVEVARDEDCLVGQLVPAGPGHVSLLRPGGEVDRTEVDEFGRFRFERSVTGPARLRCTTSSGVVVTEWVRF
ncbi:MAG TPA: hypothetical protein VN520_08570 [Streptomyces sp.]|uniref:hypothetical protein n=1 Tax=Streptomyces sp. TaxID=1931 RepID=UPI002C8D275A|nr:hypothetical protein [Streptomyces sp.]HWU06420.1 hypothetical protein [Streptomyces sp.]